MASKKWMFNDTLTGLSSGGQKTFTVNFTAIAVNHLTKEKTESQYTGFSVSLRIDPESWCISYIPYSSATKQMALVSTGEYMEYIWISNDARTVTFEEEPTGDLLTFLQANAVEIIEKPQTRFYLGGGITDFKIENTQIESVYLGDTKLWKIY